MRDRLGADEGCFCPHLGTICDWPHHKAPGNAGLRSSIRGFALRPSAACQHIQHIAAQGLPPRVAVPAMVDALQHVMPSATNCFVAVNSTSELDWFYERHPIPEAIDAFMTRSEELHRCGEPSMIGLLASHKDYGAWWDFKRKDNWDRSVMKNELFRPYNIGNNMDFVLRDQGRPKGLLTINREPGSRPFTRNELESVLTLRSHFIHAMNARHPSQPAPHDRPDEVTVAMFGTDGTLASATDEANSLLYYLKPATPGAIELTCKQAPPAVMEVLHRLQRVREGRQAQAPSLDAQTPWGKIRIVAHDMPGADTIIVTLQRLVPLTVRRLQTLATLDLAPSERRVALLMCGREDSQAIAAQAGLSISSYREYAKRIYARLNVNGRSGVKALLDS